MTLADSTVPEHFQMVQLDLAHEPGHRQGSADDRYTLLVPLGPDGEILEALARLHPGYCRVSRTDPQGDIAPGLMRPGPDNNWRFDFGVAEESGFGFGEEHFRPGEHVSILRGGDERSYRVISLQPL